MTRNREIPDGWPDSKSSQPGQFNDWQRTRRASADKRPLVSPATGAPDVPNVAKATPAPTPSGSADAPNVPNGDAVDASNIANPSLPRWESLGASVPRSYPVSVSEGRTPGAPSDLGKTRSRPLPGPPSGHPTPQQLAKPEGTSAPPTKRRRENKQGFSLGIQFWAIIILLFSGGVGFLAISLLLKLPTVPNCPSTFWPTASASMRLYCAQVAANKQTAQNLLEAIALVQALPADHPLRPEIDRHIEEWSLDLLKICEQKFQEGQLSEAIKLAKRIPAESAANKQVKQHITRWQTIWSQAEAIVQKVEQELRKLQWTQAFREASQLSYVENKYWATTKYDQLSKKIQLAREASAQLDKARELSKSDSVDSILEAIKQAEKISRDSYAYPEAQNLIADCGKRLLKMAEARLEQRNWKGVLEIANKLPASVKLGEQKADLIDLADALSKAESGTSSDLESAISIAQRLGANRPLYAQAQQLINRWQLETEDVARLERARTFANSGLVDDLKAAIAEAQQIPNGNPRYQEARREIRGWTRQVETIEDQPYLDRANQIATLGGIAPLQEAVKEAGRIAPGRALYKQAQGKIGEWTDTIQRQQDQPYLDQARALANGGNLAGAITAAQQIKPRRALYKEAQGEIRGWEAEIRGQQLLQQAYQAANPGTAAALSEAIRVARDVPRSSKAKDEARSLVNRWSYQLLSMAQDRSTYNLTEALALARMIPSGSDAYEEAQRQIQSWQKMLEPAPAPAPVEQQTIGTDSEY